MQVEKAVSEPDKPTDYFPAVNVISIGSMINSSIQQAGHGSHQATRLSGPTIQATLTFLNELNTSIDQLALTQAKLGSSG